MPFDSEKECVMWEKARNVTILVLIVGLIIRFVLMPISSSPYDIGVWTFITNETFAGGTIYSAGWNVYPPIWGQLLAVTGFISNAFDVSSFGDVFPTIYLGRELSLGYGFISNIGYTFLIKVPGLIFDILAGWAAYMLVKRLTGDQKKAVIGFALWFLAPVVFISSAAFNMFDCIMMFFIMLSLLTFMDKRYFLTGILLALAVYTKVFAILIIPIMLAYVISERDIEINERLKYILYAVVGFALISLVVYIPTIISGQFMDSLWFLTSREGAYSGFTFEPRITNLFFFLPIIAIIYILTFIIMLLSKEEREKKFLWMIILSLSILFMFPFVAYTPTYGITMLPAILILYSLKGRIALIPWALTMVFPIHGVIHYWLDMFYPMAAFTDLVGLSDIVEGFPIDGGYLFVLYLMSSAGMAIFAIIVYYLIKRGEVNKWILMLKKSVRL